MKKTKKVIRTLQTTLKNKVLEVEVYYDLGGMNYFAGRTESRGIYLAVQPVEISEHFRSYTAFSGTKLLMLPLNRFSQRKLDEFMPQEEDIEKILNHVLAKNNLTLKAA